MDRLTRSLLDFAKMVEILEAHDVSFVSVTQQFNTTSSMGRLMLNVLLSFAQFEREVTAERIRDKIAASKARGMWMGGVVPIGYRAEGRSLVPVPEEAALVQRIFARYLTLGSVNALRAELDDSGIRTPQRRHRNGRVSGGAAFSRGQLYAMLGNPLFVGRIRHREQVHIGMHPAIVDADLWETVQQHLAANRRRRAPTQLEDRSSPLAGRLVDPEGRPMRPSHASKNGRRYRYYVSAALIDSTVAQGARGWRIPAAELETAAGRAIAARLRDPAFQAQLLASGSANASAALIACLSTLAALLESSASAEGRDALRRLITRVALSESELRAEVSFAQFGEPDGSGFADLAAMEVPVFSVAAPLRLRRRGPELRIVLGGAAAPAPMPDPLLVRTLIEARCRLAAYLDPAHALTVSDIARREGTDVGDVSRSLQLAFLAPDLVERILDGTQPVGLTGERLKRAELPLLWDEQRAALA